MHRVGVAEQIVQVAQNFLICAHQKCAQIIIAAVEFMQRQRALYIAAVDELVHLAVGIASDIPQHRVATGLLVQPVNRHDGKQLLDRPAVRHALEQREVAEVRVRQHGVQAFQFFRKEIQFARHLLHLAADGPEEVLRNAALIERQIAEAEQIQRGIERLLRIVIGLQQIARIHRAQRFLEIDYGLLGIVR